MATPLSAEPPDVGRHGRLSEDYLRASQSLERPPPPPRPVDMAGRLAADYRQAVYELVTNQTDFFRVLMDERFAVGGPGWTNDPLGEARRVEGGYRLLPLVENHFLAIGAPVGSTLRDVQLGATFRKLGGPSGGTYGLLLRDRGPGPRDGRNQTGRYYVAQVDDRGLVGIWRRDHDRWFDLVPWAACDSVRPGVASNDLSFEVVGGRLTLIVNGRAAASANDSVLEHGGVGLFVGGLGNAVMMERFVVHELG